jgi:hypothetical protein
LLRDAGDAAVTREAEAIERETERLKLLTVNREDVLEDLVSGSYPSKSES